MHICTRYLFVSKTEWTNINIVLKISLRNLIVINLICNFYSWERISGKHLATAHKGEIKIFDIKNLKIPKEYISAHPSKLFSLDFSPVRENQLVSCTASTIKMWDLSSACVQPVHTIQVNR